MHSTGVASVERHTTKVHSAKAPGGPSNLMSLQDYKDTIFGNPRIILGHNRFATVGAHTAENAHPFVFDNIIGAHNGTLHVSDREKLHNYKEYGTDSQAIFSNMNEFGADTTILGLTDYDSAYALTWYEVKDNTIHIIRNEKRPLHYVYSSDRCTLFWASEARFLQFAADQAGVKLEEDIYAPEPNKHFWWEIPKTINEKFKQPFALEVKPVKVYAYTGPQYYDGGQWHDGYRKDKHKHSYNSIVKDGNVYHFNSQRKNTKNWKPPYKDSRGHILNKVQFLEMTDQGCCFCGSANQSWGDFVQPFRCGVGSEYDYICEQCYNDDETYNLCKNLI